MPHYRILTIWQITKMMEEYMYNQSEDILREYYKEIEKQNITMRLKGPKHMDKKILKVKKRVDEKKRKHKKKTAIGS